MKHLYFCSCDTAGGIYHYTLSDGKLDFCEKTDLDRPTYMIIEGKKVYITLRETDAETHFGGVVTADIDVHGKLVNVSRLQSSGGLVPCHLCVLNGEIYVANYLSGNVVKLPDTVVKHEGKGTDPDRQEAPHTHFVTAAPDGFILCCDLGLDTVFVYDKDLNEISKSKVPDGMGVRHLVFSKDSKTVYAVNELGNSVSRFAYFGGKLEYIDTVDALPRFQGPNTAAAIRIQGDYLYVSHRGADTVARFKINADGSLKLLENSPCGGRSPRDFIIDDGYIFCTNEETDNVSVLKLGDGLPELCGNVIRMKHPLCVCSLEI